MSTLQLARIDVSPAKSQKLKKKALSEKFDQTLSSRRKIRRTLPLENSQNKRRKFKPCHQEEHINFGFG
jgi:hypothetical protein